MAYPLSSIRVVESRFLKDTGYCVIEFPDWTRLKLRSAEYEYLEEFVIALAKGSSKNREVPKNLEG